MNYYYLVTILKRLILSSQFHYKNTFRLSVIIVPMCYVYVQVINANQHLHNVVSYPGQHDICIYVVRDQWLGMHSGTEL